MAKFYGVIGYGITKEETIEVPGETPGTTVKVGTGLAFELPENTFAAIFARSGLATKEGLRPANCVGKK